MSNIIEARLNLQLHAGQRVIHESKARFKVVKAGKRYGKTLWSLFELCKRAGLSSNKTYFYISPTYSQSKKIAWHTLDWLLPHAFVKRSLETELTKVLINGSRIILVGADNPDSLRGIKMAGAVFDEAAYVAEDLWPLVMGQLLGDADRFCYFISSPNAKGRNWFSNFWDEAKARQNAGDPEWAAWYFSIWDNPTLTRDDIQKLKDITSDDKWDLEYEAKESDLAGQLYWEFDQAKHVAEIQDGTWDQIHRSFDWGIDHPTVALYAKINIKAPRVYVFDEFFKSGLVIREVCEANHKIMDVKLIDREIIDPSANRRDQTTGRSVKDEFARWGIYCTDGDRRDRGYDIVKMFLKSGIVTIHPRCKNLIYQLKNLQRGDKVGDDAPDALRYLLTYIHDTVFNGNVFENLAVRPSATPKVYPPYTPELNMWDENLFKKENSRQDSWISEECLSD